MINHELIALSVLDKKEIEDFVHIEFESFHNMMVSIYSNHLEDGFNIRKTEIAKNMDKGHYFVAKMGKNIVGTIEMIDQSVIDGCQSDFRLYYQNLGFLKAFKAYFFSSIKPYQMDEKTIYLDTIAVTKKYRGQGLATKILQLTQQLAQKKGMHFLSLWVAQDNPIAYRVYEKFGFRPIIRKKTLIGSWIFKHGTWIYMKKKIIP